MTAPEPKPDGSSAWYARGRRPPRVMLYRVNRRPRAQQPLGARPVGDFFEDLLETLPFNEPFITGRRYQREWRLANQDVVDFQDRPALQGRIGFRRHEEHATGEFDPEEGWHDVVRAVDEGAFAPFLIDSATRILAVIRHPEFKNPTTVAEVFSGLLNEAEEARDTATVDWAVEPILDESGFYAWLSNTPVIERVRFVAKQPNPDAIEGHEFIDNRLTRLNADRIEEEIATQRESGLRNLEQDPQVQAYVDSGRQGFAYVTADGHDERRSRHFDQRRQLASESLSTIPGTWPDLIAGMMGTVQRWLATRQAREGEDQ